MRSRDGVLARVIEASGGQTLTEYSMVVMFVGLAAFSAYEGLGQGIKIFASNILSFISTAIAAL